MTDDPGRPDSAAPADAHPEEAAPRLGYALDTLLIEIGRLNRVIRRLEETPAVGINSRVERADRVATLRRRVVELLDAMDVLGAAQDAAEDLPDGA